MEIIVVSGIRDCVSKVAEKCVELERDGYQEISNLAFGNVHPKDIVDDVFDQVSRLNGSTCFTAGKYFIDTNSEHVINALRVLRKQKKIDSFKVIHYGNVDEQEIVICGDDGEFDHYPENFLDEWPNMMALLA